MTTFYQNVANWAIQRNFPEGSTYTKQRTKTWEELTELAEGMAKSKLELAKDAIGDCAVTTSNTAGCLGLDVVEIGKAAALRAETARADFDAYDIDGLMNLFIQHNAAVRKANAPVLKFDLDSGMVPEYHLVIALAALQHCAERLGLTFDECQDFAWDQIKDRKGGMVNQTYVKEADLQATLESVTKKALEDAVATDEFKALVVNNPAYAGNSLFDLVSDRLIEQTGALFNNLNASVNTMTGEASVKVQFSAFDTPFPVAVSTRYADAAAE